MQIRIPVRIVEEASAEDFERLTAVIAAHLPAQHLSLTDDYLVIEVEEAALLQKIRQAIAPLLTPAA